MISRTNSEEELKRTLVFRTEDVQNHFKADGDSITYETERYKLYKSFEKVEIDSLLDNTDNFLKIRAVNDCFQILASDKNIIMVLSSPHEITLVNTHKSIVPQKWPKKYVLDEVVSWARIDENVQTLFAQLPNGSIKVYDISGDHVIFIENLGGYEARFELDQKGAVLAKRKNANQLTKIQTNVMDIDFLNEKESFSGVLKNLSDLFKGEAVFTQKRFAKIVEEEKSETDQMLPSAIEKARFDFESNVEHMLAANGETYEDLLKVKNKVAIARQNIREELSSYAEREGIFLVGQRLQKTMNDIIGPIEKKVNNLLELSRATFILKQSKEYKEQLSKLKNPSAYREILNTLRVFNAELQGMEAENRDVIYSEFKIIQKELNASFSEQIAGDGNALNEFINGEIVQIEKSIENSHDLKALESLLNTHPAAVELMVLLKQPFVLESISKGKQLSPAGIQTRLYGLLKDRKKILQFEIQKKEKERHEAKLQLSEMIQESIAFFVDHHTGSFSDLELNSTATYQSILNDILNLERTFEDLRLANELRRKLERRILEKNREDLEKIVSLEGRYAYIQNDPDLYVDLESNVLKLPLWKMKLIRNKQSEEGYHVIYERSTDKLTHRPGIVENLEADMAFEIKTEDFNDYIENFKQYVQDAQSLELLECLWKIIKKEQTASDYPQYDDALITRLVPSSENSKKALRCAIEKKRKDFEERTRKRNVPEIAAEYIDETPYFQQKLQEFIIKVKLQMMSKSGVILLTGPPSTGKSAFLRFAASIMNREYFEHAADKWQTKNSLVTAIKFGDGGPYATPAGFIRAITTSHCLVNIEEIKEWTEAMRKSLNPFFAGSKTFIAQDGTQYEIGNNVLLCAAANLGAMYREDDEPFTADFWSRIEVVDFDYAPEKVDRNYMLDLHKGQDKTFLTMQDLVREYFYYYQAPADIKSKAVFFSKQILKFILLPKTDDKIKKESLEAQIDEYFFEIAEQDLQDTFSPEEATKIALRRLKDLQGYSAKEFFDLYDHFVNGESFRLSSLTTLQYLNNVRYKQLNILFLCIRFLEGALRNLREKFYSSVGQTEIEGTNREFIKGIFLLDLLGKLD